MKKRIALDLKVDVASAQAVFDKDLKLHDSQINNSDDSTHIM